MRGAIGFPEGDKQGFALMAGQELTTRKIYIFEQEWFWTIDHWLNPDGTIKQTDDGGYHLGLVQYIKDWEALYKCASYFHGGQHVDVVRRHSLDIYRNIMIPKSIELIEVPYVKEVGDDLIREKGQTQRFVFQNGSPMHESINQWIQLQTVGTGDNNAIQAMRALLAGYEAMPFVSMEMP